MAPKPEDIAASRKKIKNYAEARTKSRKNKRGVAWWLKPYDDLLELYGDPSLTYEERGKRLGVGIGTVRKIRTQYFWFYPHPINPKHYARVVSRPTKEKIREAAFYAEEKIVRLSAHLPPDEFKIEPIWLAGKISAFDVKINGCVFPLSYLTHPWYSNRKLPYAHLGVSRKNVGLRIILVNIQVGGETYEEIYALPTSTLSKGGEHIPIGPRLNTGRKPARNWEEFRGNKALEFIRATILEASRIS
jgi:hypothetical protein